MGDGRWVVAAAFSPSRSCSRSARFQRPFMRRTHQRDFAPNANTRADPSRARATRAASGGVAGTVHDLNEEVTNLDGAAKQRAYRQTLDSNSRRSQRRRRAPRKVASTEKELTEKSVTLHKRLVDIYKRGPMQTTEALLSARSFGELIARYKYLHLLALHDRALVEARRAAASRCRRIRSDSSAFRTALEESRSDKSSRGRAASRTRAGAQLEPHADAHAGAPGAGAASRS